MIGSTPLDLRLYLVLDPRRCNGIKGIVDTTIQAVENGVTVVQLRAEPDWKKRQWYEAAVALKKALAPYRVPLIINDHVDIALAVDASGVHIGQKDLPVNVVRKLIGDHKWLGLSVSNASQLAAVPTELVDYIGIGPIFPTTSKPDADPALGIDQLALLMQHLMQHPLIQHKHCPTVAIGGITSNNAAAIMQTGVDGIAVVSAICGQVDPALATRQLYRCLQK